jgi:phosphatidylserine/phosphatidylglycerophosphate/cardiolipin synthase-like enzyme
MKLYFDYKDKRNLAVLLKFIPKEVEYIYAAIAFNYDNILIKTCIDKKIRLDIWGLFNSDISTDVELIKTAIKSSLVKFYPFANHFHPKVIYFKNYGLYVGSINMTKNGLYNNVEAGVFLERQDLTSEIINEIETFFDFLRENSIPATQDDIQLLEEYQEEIKNDKDQIENKKSNIDDLFDEKFSHLFLLKAGVTDWEKTKKDTNDKRKLLFLQEWRETQNFIAIVHKEILKIYDKLSWVTENADPKIVTDQLLQSYYYDYILKGKEEVKSIVKVNERY